MARIRSIKPGFWQDSRLARLPALTRLVYICLWSMADDDGRIEGDAETVWHFGFPREKVEDISRALAKLREESRVVMYRGNDGVDLMFLPFLRKHQKIDHPTASKLPAPPTLTSDSRSFASDHRGLAKSRGGLDGMGEDWNGGDGRGSEGIQGEEEVAPVGAPARVPSKPVRVTSPQEAVAKRLAAALGSSVNPCRKQVAALVANGWDLPRVDDAVSKYAQPGLAPWDWTKAARNNGRGNGALSPSQILDLQHLLPEDPS